MDWECAAPPIVITEFQFSERADAKVWDHGIAFEQISALLEQRYVVIRNRKHRAVDALLIGRDNSGRCIAVPILPADDPYIWQPVTAWYCKPAEYAALRSKR